MTGVTKRILDASGELVVNKFGLNTVLSLVRKNQRDDIVQIIAKAVDGALGCQYNVMIDVNSDDAGISGVSLSIERTS